ncbi:MAG: carboxypeptidase-like regulatory domain-containing protein, partial [Caldilineaceae bacterium]
MLRLSTNYLWIFCIALLLSACAPTPEGNVIGYLLEQQLGGGKNTPAIVAAGSIQGEVWMEGRPAPGVSVLVAERTGTPHATTTDAEGRYRIDGVPPGQYVVAAVGPESDEASLTGAWGVPWLVTVTADTVTDAPRLTVQRHIAAPLPDNLGEALHLSAGLPYTASAPFPAGSVAWGQAFAFERDGAVIDTLRVYHPLAESEHPLPLIFGVFPGVIDGWQPVSVAFAAAGYTVVAISPSGTRGLDVYAHAEDARVALHLARRGLLGVDVADAPAVAMGGSFSSAILHRLLRAEGDQFAAWVTVGGISNAFSGAADFYAGRLAIPEQYALVIPALGPADLHPAQFLRYSPVYTAGELP